MIRLITILVVLLFSTNLFADLDLLIHTSDTSPYNTPKNTWTKVMEDDDRASNMKQGYLQRAKPVGNNTWGSMEKDPKRFLHIIIPDAKFNPVWLEPLLDINGEDIQDRIWKFDIKKILTIAEYNALINIPFNDTTVRPAIVKIINNPENFIELVDWNKEKARIPLKLHGSAGTFEIQADGGGAGGYTSLRTCVETEAADISGGSEDVIINIQEAWASADVGNWDIDGWTMGTNEMIITTEGASRHDGTPAGTTYRISNATQGFDIEEDNVTVDGIEVILAQNGLESSLDGNGITIKYCLITGQTSDTSFGVRINGTGGGDADVINCVFNKSKQTETDSEGILISGGVTGAVNIFNTTVGGYDDGIENDSGNATVVATNCAVFNNNVDFDVQGGSITINFCASDDDDGTNSVDISPGGTEADDWNNAFTDYVNNDLSVKNASSVIENAGTNLSGSGVTDDIIGTARPQDSTYDIGAWEFIVAGAARRIMSIQ